MYALLGKAFAAATIFAIFTAFPFIGSAQAEDGTVNWAGMPQVDIGFFSVGGRATYFDPKEGDAKWFGGAQLRIHPLRTAPPAVAAGTILFSGNSGETQSG